MTTLAQVLQDHDIVASESQVVAEFSALLGAKSPSVGAALTVGEQEFLDKHGGIPAASTEQLQELDGRSAARALAEASDALSRTQVAQLMATDVTRVSHRTRDGSLYSYAGASHRRRYPTWQFVDGVPLPHLAAIVSVLPAGTHPVTVRSFFCTPDDALVLAEVPVSPARWLASGGPPDPVIALAGTLAEQV